MELFNSRPEKRNWLRFAMKLGLLATDAAVWASLNRMLSDREGVRSSVHPRDRMAVELNRRGWSHTTTFLTGIGIGVGLGIIFAPMPGEQARIAIRDTARNIKTKTGIGIGVGLGIIFAPMPGEQARIAIRDTARNIKTKVDDVAGWARWDSTSAHRRSTGTYAD